MFYSDGEIWVSGYIGKKDFISNMHQIDFLQGMSCFKFGKVAGGGEFVKFENI